MLTQQALPVLCDLPKSRLASGGRTQQGSSRSECWSKRLSLILLIVCKDDNRHALLGSDARSDLAVRIPLCKTLEQLRQSP